MGEAAQLADQHDTEAPTAAPLPPDLLPRWVQTQEAYRLLLAGGFDGADAAMLIGSIVIAIPVTLLTYFVIKRFAESWARKRNQPKHSD